MQAKLFYKEYIRFINIHIFHNILCNQIIFGEKKQLRKFYTHHDFDKINIYIVTRICNLQRLHTYSYTLDYAYYVHIHIYPNSITSLNYHRIKESYSSYHLIIFFYYFYL